MEYISREAATVAAFRAVWGGGSVTSIEREINEVPAANVAPVVYGQWVLDSSDEYANHYHCSRCGKKIDLCNEMYEEPTPHYCSDCGAKMKEG